MALLGCWLAAFCAAGCGGDDEPVGAPLPRAAVAELDKQLRSIENRYAFGDGACGDVERDNRPSVRRTLDGLPDSVDPDVRRALRQSFARLFELARRDCNRGTPAPVQAPPTPPATPASPPPPVVTPSPQTPVSPPAASARPPSETSDSGAASTAETSPSSTYPRPTSRPPPPPADASPNQESVPDQPSQTETGADSSGAPGLDGRPVPPTAAQGDALTDVP